jgi:hypothetical protein
MNHVQLENDLYKNADDNEIFIDEGGQKIERQCGRREK